MEKYFYLDESPVYTNKYVIRLNYDKFLFPHGTRGSFDVIIARLLNLSYTDYLRYTRDRLGAELIGKNSKYITVYLDKNETTNMFIKLLNTRMEYIINEHNFPYEYKLEGGTVIRTDLNYNENKI